mgnify:CR=1 FL=1
MWNQDKKGFDNPEKTFDWFPEFEEDSFGETSDDYGDLVDLKKAVVDPDAKISADGLPDDQMDGRLEADKADGLNFSESVCSNAFEEVYLELTGYSRKVDGLFLEDRLEPFRDKCTVISNQLDGNMPDLSVMKMQRCCEDGGCIIALLTEESLSELALIDASENRGRLRTAWVRIVDQENFMLRDYTPDLFTDKIISSEAFGKLCGLFLEIYK